MFHTNTDHLIGYWRSLSRGAATPRRTDFDPAAVAELLPQIFMLELGAGSLPFRLAGEFLIDLHGKTLRGLDFQTLFSPGGRRVVTQAALSALNAPDPVVLLCEAVSAEGRTLTLEIVLAPLAGEDGRVERLLGLYQPTSLVARLGGRPVAEINARLANDDGRGHLRLVVADGLRIA
ncbi:MAG: PAS domain-containing protein [Caulobacteraceae bacterium]|nr:PAS domain-containing protein [Caulobacteraceae bacterium]